MNTAGRLNITSTHLEESVKSQILQSIQLSDIQSYSLSLGSPHKHPIFYRLLAIIITCIGLYTVYLLYPLAETLPRLPGGHKGSAEGNALGILLAGIFFIPVGMYFLYDSFRKNYVLTVTSPHASMNFDFGKSTSRTEAESFTERIAHL